LGLPDGPDVEDEDLVHEGTDAKVDDDPAG
jgi:hypothetical protein